VRAYLPDEADHTSLRAQLLEGDDAVVSSELARVEFASAAHAARRARRRMGPGGPLGLMARFDADCSGGGPMSLVLLRPDVVMPRAYQVVVDHRVRTLDAMHLAVALDVAARLADGDQLAFVTRDQAQATAARSLGLSVS